MRYGYFDNEKREYVIDRLDLPTSWQPVGKSSDEAKYVTRHGLSYSVYECEYDGVKSSQRMISLNYSR